MHQLQADLVAFYDQDAAVRVDRPVGDDRSTWRQSFIDALPTKRPLNLLEVGCGPGRDAGAFEAQGIGVTGLDLSIEQLRLARDRHVVPVRGSLLDIPFRRGFFDAVWAMSTLIHIPDARFDDAMSQLCAAAVPGALIGMGLWGGGDHEGTADFDSIEPPRFFARRSHERLRAMLEPFGSVVLFETKDFGLGEDGGVYQFVVLRIR